MYWYWSPILTVSLAVLAAHAHPRKPKKAPPPPKGLLQHPNHANSNGTMAAAAPSTGPTPRLILYQQTHHEPNGKAISLLPLLTEKTGITHLYIAALHLNGPGNVTLNDHAPGDARHDQLWREVKVLQDAGVKVMGMLGGAAKGSFERLSGKEEHVCLSCRRPS
jgi:hypothetical protein